MTTEIITALDVQNSAALQETVDRLPSELDFYKVGLELFSAEGPAALTPLHQADKRIFLDLKLHDIPRTVAHAVRSVSQHQVDLLTLHAGGGRAMMQAAAEAAAEYGQGRLKLIAVTVLTSLDEDDLRRMNISSSPREQALTLAAQAMEAGLDGVVCSPWEAEAIRKEIGPDKLIVTPGIRLATDSLGDQKRVATPSMAVNAGASALVIGRPIVQASDPAAAYRAICADLEENVV